MAPLPEAVGVVVVVVLTVVVVVAGAGAACCIGELVGLAGWTVTVVTVVTVVVAVRLTVTRVTVVTVVAGVGCVMTVFGGSTTSRGRTLAPLRSSVGPAAEACRAALLELPLLRVAAAESGPSRAPGPRA